MFPILKCPFGGVKNIEYTVDVCLSDFSGLFLITNWLVVWNMNFIFHNIWDVILPIDELIFFKMVIAPPTGLKFTQSGSAGKREKRSPRIGFGR